ncbi:MAG: hypothetical protein PHV88_00805 [Eubacteriales bacterium]|nr:hypothetical protein [Eubacteriales bacterium]MDD4327432.1 hypothetical protein [Eubacteriales bacterium]
MPKMRSKRPVVLLIVYGLGKQPMLLATNKVIHVKEDVINIVRTYMSRWRIEEYFRFKKQQYAVPSAHSKCQSTAKGYLVLLLSARGRYFIDTRVCQIRNQKVVPYTTKETETVGNEMGRIKIS